MTQHHASWAEKQAQKDKLKLSERGGEVVGMVIVGLVALFFYTHQAQATGFFTSSFGSLESFLLYGGILLGLAGPAVRMAVGSRNAARPPEMLTSLFWIAGSAWLLAVFPFDFSHLGDIVPEFLRFLVIWITNDIARILMILGIAGGIVSIAFNTILYAKVRALLAHADARPE
jgi:hypothetical protein